MAAAGEEYLLLLWKCVAVFYINFSVLCFQLVQAGCILAIRV